jgi:hypothetical protein
MAQEWPNKPITFIVPFPAGGGTDAFARPLAAQLTKQLGKQIIIDNRGGAGGTLGASLAAKAAPDGYTFFMGAAHHAIAPAMYPNLDYDIEPDQKFKDRLKKAIEGHTTMGNAPTTEKTDVKPSNGSKLGEEPKDKDGNVIPTPETAKGIEKQVKDRQKDKDSRELYNKQAVPVKSKSINEEVEKMKKMFNYNKKTQ